MRGMISKAVRQRIKEFRPGVIFGLKDFAELPNSQAVILELGRLAKKGEITRLTKGKYYVPRNSRFGTLGPDEWRVLDKVVKENGGYFAGTTALNRLGVTTQIPSEVTIRGARSTRKLKIGYLTINLTRDGNSGADATAPNLTDMLETLRLIKRTPGGNLKMSVEKVGTVLRARACDEIERLLDIAEKERPYVRSLLGAIMEMNQIDGFEQLKKTLNPVTKFRLGIPLDVIPIKVKWGIV